jgi:hypothetical protein
VSEQQQATDKMRTAAWREQGTWRGYRTWARSTSSSKVRGRDEEGSRRCDYIAAERVEQGASSVAGACPSMVPLQWRKNGFLNGAPVGRETGSHGSGRASRRCGATMAAATVQ